MGNSVHCPPLDAKLHPVILERCLAYLGLPNTYALIGGGSCGSAYLSNGRVYKITTDQSEAVESKKVIGQNNNHLVNIFDVKKVNNTLADMDVYLIVMEHLRTDRQAIFADIEEMLIHLFEEAFDKHLFDIIYYYRFSPAIYKNEYEYEINQILAVHQREKYYYDSLLKIADELNDNDIQSMDFQYHNLGLKPNGNIAFFDLGYGEQTGSVDTINERVKSYMKNSSAVGIARKCKFGGNPDGTSNACNKGDISNITMKPIREEKFYRVDSGFSPPRGTTAMDVVKFEMEENGNVEEMEGALAIAQQHGIDLNKYPAKNLVWVTKTPEDAMRYGDEVEEVEINNPVVLADDGDNGYLVLNKNISDLQSTIVEGQDTKIEYGALMLNINIPKWNEITNMIDKDDVYDKPTFGVEHNPHVTILYGFHKEVTVKEVEQLLKEKHDPTDKIKLDLIGISHFETPNYDVVKFDVKSEKLMELNKLMKKLPYTSDYPDYHPHLTISYVKKGTGKKYDEKFDENIELASNNIVYSTVKGKKTTINEHTSKWNQRRENKLMNEDLKVGLNDLPFKNDVEQAGGKLYSVGGAVRDQILGKESKDLDILITGIPLDQLEQILLKYGKVDSVGKSFGIIKFNTPQTGEIDIAIPRTERKNDQGGYQGFDVTSDHSLPIEKDLERRDFTINAIAKDSSGLMIDPYGGQGDIEKKQIKMVNPQAFSDDPLRMLRAVQFAARFGFSIEPETMAAIQQNAEKIREISPERILIEFDKIVKKGDPMTGAKLLRQTGLYGQIFGINRGINLAEFKNVKTMGEFIFALLNGAMKNPSEFYKNNMKGDLDTYNELRALEIGKSYNGNLKTIFDMYKTYPKIIDSAYLSPMLKEAIAFMRSNNMPFSLKDIPVDGNDLMRLGLKGKQIGDTFVEILNKIYRRELANEREAILDHVRNNLTENQYA